MVHNTWLSQWWGHGGEGEGGGGLATSDQVDPVALVGPSSNPSPIVSN